MDTAKRTLTMTAGLISISLLAMLGLLTAISQTAGAATGSAKLSLTVCTAGPPDCDYAIIQEAVDAAGAGDLIKVAAGTYTGVQGRPAPPGYAFPPPSGLITQVVYLSETLTICGGYTTSNGFADPPDPVAHPTTVDAQGLGRVFFVGAESGLISPTIEGLRITHGDGTGLGGHPWFSNMDLVAGIYALSASATISNNWVLDNATADFCAGVTFMGGSITVEGNTISGNRATWGGGGMCVAGCSGTIRGNTLYDNVAVGGNVGGLGVYSSDVTLEGNSFISNTAGTQGGGLEVNASTVALIGNTFISNTAGSWGGAMEIREYDNDVTLEGNSFFSNTAETLGGGLYVEGVTSTVTLDGNTFSGNAAASGGAVYLNQTPATLNGNTITSNSGNYGGGLYLTGSDAALDGNTISANVAQDNGGGLYLSSYSNPTLTNNLVADNQAGTTGSGLYIGYSSPTLLHSTIARNSGGDGSGLYLAGSGTTTMSNTVLVSHTVGVTVTANATAVLEATLWGSGPWANLQDWGGSGSIVTGTINLWADPAFLDPAAGDYHLALASAAIDAGMDAGVSSDIDGEARPMGSGYDIGADEFPCGFEPYEGNPLLEPEAPGAWDSDLVFAPAALISDGVTHLFYAGSSDYPTVPLSIGYATSTNGLTFTKSVSNPVFSGDGAGFDANEVVPGPLLWEDGTWVLYYGGSATTWSHMAVGRAMAPRPAGPWARLDDPVLPKGPPGAWDERFVMANSVISTTGGYVMYYTGAITTGARWQIGMATSPDGISWTKYADNPVLTPTLAWEYAGVFAPQVRQTPSGWEMFYTGGAPSGGTVRAIGYATSADGIHWTRHPDNPILHPDDDPVATMWIEAPAIVMHGDTYWMYYDYLADSAVGLAQGSVCCAPVEEVAIAGPDLLLPGETGPYTATHAPPGATPPVTLTWDNGTIGYNSVYSWTTPGVYTITVTATNPCGQAHGVWAVLVCDPPSAADFAWNPFTPTVNESVTFSGTAAGSPPPTYHWTFGDGFTATGQIAAHTYTATGTYTVTMVAANDCGEDQAIHALTAISGCHDVYNAAFTWSPPEPEAGQVVTLTGSARGTAPFGFSWDLGDGNTAAGQLVTHTYASAGTYTVVMTVTNCATGTATVVHTLTVVIGCHDVYDAAFTWSPPEPEAGQVVTLTGSAHGTAPFGFSWDLGDGNTAAGQLVTHTYASAGTYTVVMTVTNCATGTATVVHTLTVTPPPTPCIPLEGVTVAGPASLFVGELGRYTATATPITATTPLTYTWDNGAMEPTAVYSWTLPGTYTLIVTATNPCAVLVTGSYVVDVYVEYRIYLPLVLRE